MTLNDLRETYRSARDLVDHCNDHGLTDHAARAAGLRNKLLAEIARRANRPST